MVEEGSKGLRSGSCCFVVASIDWTQYYIVHHDGDILMCIVCFSLFSFALHGFQSGVTWKLDWIFGDRPRNVMPKPNAGEPPLLLVACSFLFSRQRLVIIIIVVAGIDQVIQRTYQQPTSITMSSPYASPRGGNTRAPVYQIDFTAVASGKRIASTKRRVRW